MKGVYLLVVLLTIYTYIFLVTGIEEPYCFNFTWPGPTVSELNCEEHNKDNPFTPCIKPFIHDTKPNVTEIWNNRRDNKTYIQQLQPGNVCVRYSYMYNGAVINVSYFHGRVTEDQTTPVTSGCYVQYIEGYSIEVCACKSNDGNSTPCNSTIRNTYSMLIISVTTAVSLLMYKIFKIP